MSYGVEVLLTTKYHCTTLPCLPGQRDTEERGYTIMQVTMEALLTVLLTVMEYFHCHPRVVRILRRSCRITPNRIHQSLYYPQCNEMTSDRKTWLQYKYR